jgi:hypothetical protein
MNFRIEMDYHKMEPVSFHNPDLIVLQFLIL